MNLNRFSMFSLILASTMPKQAGLGVRPLTAVFALWIGKDRVYHKDQFARGAA
jgi:hypothetical protein